MIAIASLLFFQSTSAPPQRELLHTAPVQKLAVDARAKILFTAARTGDKETMELRCWDLKKRVELWKTRVFAGDLHDLSSSESKLYYSYPGASACNYVRIEDGKAGLSIGGPDVSNPATSFVCESDDSWVWIGTPKGLLRLTPGELKGWKTRNTDEVGVTSLALAPNEKDLVIGGQDGVIRWGHAGNASISKKRTEGHEGAVTHLMFGHKGKLLVSASDDGTVRLWSSSGKKRLVISANKLGQHQVESIVCDPKGDWVAAALDDKSIRFFDTKKGEMIAQFEDSALVPSSGMVLIDKGKTLITGGEKSLLFWDISKLRK